MRYEIDQETFAVSIFDDGADVPFWFQPDYPNMDKFDSVEEATAWAESAIAAYNPDCLYFPKDGKDIEPRLKPTAAELAEAEKQMEAKRHGN